MQLVIVDIPFMRGLNVLIAGHRIQRPGPRLPAELTDEIIAWVAHWQITEEPLGPHPYYSTLLSCCLVCSQWLPASRNQLFQHTYLRTSKNYDLFMSRVLSQGSMDIYLSAIRILTLVDIVRWPKQWYRPSSSPFAYAFVGHLPNLTILEVFGGGLMTYLCRHPHTPFALSNFSCIRELRISKDKFPSFGDLRRTLTSLPNLTVLSMETSVCWPEPTAELSPLLRHGASTSSRPRLVELSYTLDDTSAASKRRTRQLLTWLALTSTGVSLRRLTLKPNGIYGDICGPAFVHTIARCVEELTLEMQSDNG